MRFLSLTLCVGIAAFALADPTPAPGVAGIWEGALNLGVLKMRLVFKVEKKPDGTLSTTMDSPDQGAKDIPIESTKFEDGQLKLSSEKMKAEFAGKISADGKSMSGDWKQAGQSFPLELKRVDKATEVRRPQEPKKPYPYLEEEVTVANDEAKITLAGTFTKPKEGGPFAAVVMATGSGPQDRDEAILGHKPFLIIADHLTRQGIAVLRCDDRGVGKSTGNFKEATTADFATDIYAAVKYLKSRPDVDPKRIGIAGHSEGGIIGPMVAAAHPDDVGFLVLLAGTGLPGDEILCDQQAAVARAQGESETEIAQSRELQKQLIAIAKAGGPKDEVLKKIKDRANDFIAKLPEEDRKKAEKEMKEGEKQFAAITTVWFQYFLNHDPRPTLKKVRCPVLALNGEKDLQVTPKENLAAIGTALKEGGNSRVTLKELQGLNHLFQHCKTGHPNEYAGIEETFAPEALDAMAKWILGLK
jgi:pimeloyl-ACP methyl ester carboxylesterase